MSLLRARMFAGLGVAALTLSAAFPTFAQVIIKPGPGIPVPVDPSNPMNPPKDKPKDGPAGIDLPIDEKARARFDAVLSYLNGKDPINARTWEDIIGVLQTMLDNEQDRILPPDKSGAMPSIRREANRIIGLFPPEGKQFYERIKGPDARETLNKAIEENNWEVVGHVAQRYLHTKAGAEANILIGTYFLDRGKYTDAALRFRDFLATRPAGEELPPSVLFKAALAFKRQSNDPDFAKSAQKYWDLFEKAAGKNKVTLGNKEFTVEDLRRTFDKVTATNKPTTAATDITRSGITPDNNGQGKGGRPFLDNRFVIDLLKPNYFLAVPDKTPAGVTSPDDLRAKATENFKWIEGKLKDALENAERLKRAAIPGAQAIAASGKIIFRSYDGVYCFATRDDARTETKAGDLVWFSKAQAGLFQQVEEPNRRTSTNTQYDLLKNNNMFGLLYENSNIGTLSHDGQYCYLVDDIALPPMPSPGQFGAIDPFTGRPYTNNTGPLEPMIRSSRLSAVQIETGKLVWTAGKSISSQGGADKTNAPIEVSPSAKFLSDAVFLGAPLPLNGKIYAIVEKDGGRDSGLYLICIDPNLQHSDRHPQILWSQLLGTPNTPIFMDNPRRTQALHLAYADGVLVCPTNTGAVIGVDVLTHSILWASAYRSNRVSQGQENIGGNIGFPRPGIPNPNNSVDNGKDRWRRSAPIIADGKVVFTAWDSDTIECVSLQEGRPMWTNPIPREEGDLYVAGVFGDKIMVVNRAFVKFYRLSDGARLEVQTNGTDKTRLGLTGVTGIGAASDGIYYVPVRGSDKDGRSGVQLIDLKEMKLGSLVRSRKNDAPGNLLFYDGDVYSQSITTLTAYPQLDVKRAEMEKRLAANPKDPAGLLDLGLIKLDEGKRQEAADSFRNVLANNPDDVIRSKAREKLFETLTETLLEDYDNGEKYLAEYKELCTVEIPPTAPQAVKDTLKNEEIRRKRDYHCLVGKGKEKQGKLFEAFESYMTFGTLGGTDEMVTVLGEAGIQVRPATWARARILSMIKGAKPEQIKPIEQSVLKRWEEVKNDDIIKIRDFVRIFSGMFEVGNDAKMFLCDKLMNGTEEESREAEYMLLAARAGEDQSLAARSVEVLARLYAKKNLLDDAMGMYAELGDRFAKTKLRDGRTGADLFGDVVVDPRFLPFLEPNAQVWAYNKMKANDYAGSIPYNNNIGRVVDLSTSEKLPFFNRYALQIDQSNRFGAGWALQVWDKNEQKAYHTFPATGGYFNYDYLFQQSGTPYRPIQVTGHIAIFTSHMSDPQTGMPLSKIFAYDLVDKKELWNETLYGKVGVNRQVIRQDNEFDGPRVSYQDGWSQKIGQQWVVQPNYVCYTNREGIVARETTKGTILWKKQASARTYVFGDAEYVIAGEVAGDGTITGLRIYNAIDGSEVAVPPAAGLLTNLKNAQLYGRNLLALDKKDKEQTIRMVDLVKGTDVWSKKIGADAFILRSDNRTVGGYVSTSGEVVLFNTVTGKELLNTKLESKKLKEHFEKVNEVVLMSDRERFFLMLNRPSENRFGFSPAFQQQLQGTRVNGHMYCLDKTSGKTLWYTDHQLLNQNIMVEMFNELPLIVAASNNPPANGGNFSLKTIVIDKATGKVKFDKNFGQASGYYMIAVDWKKGTVDLQNYNGQRIRLSPDDGKPASDAGSGTSPTGSAPVVLPGVINRRIIIQGNIGGRIEIAD